MVAYSEMKCIPQVCLFPVPETTVRRELFSIFTVSIENWLEMNPGKQHDVSEFQKMDLMAQKIYTVFLG